MRKIIKELIAASAFRRLNPDGPDDPRTILGIDTKQMHAMPEWGVWQGIKQRCRNPNYREFHYYGGRGIKVCDRWDNFAYFYLDVGPRAHSQLSIDRFPDNNGNYEPGNARWATSKEQNNNKRKRSKNKIRKAIDKGIGIPV